MDAESDWEWGSGQFRETAVRLTDVYTPVPLDASVLLLPADLSLRGLLRLGRRHGVVLRQHRGGELTRREAGVALPPGSLFWFGQSPEREYTVWVARHSTGWSVRVVCAAGEVRLSHADPESVWIGLAALLGSDWSHRLLVVLY